MLNLKSLTAAVVTAAALSTTASAAQPAPVLQDVVAAEGVLNGTVLDAAGRPQPGVAVTIVREGRAVAATQSAADGSYRITGLTTGVYGLQANGNVRPVRVWNGFAPAAAVDSVALVSGTEIVNGNHDLYSPECNTGCPQSGGTTAYAAPQTYSTGQVYYSQACQQPAQKRCGSNGFLSNGLSNTAAVTGLALGITGVAIASSNSDDIDSLEAEVRRRGEIMDAREATIAEFQQRLEALENAVSP